MPFSSVPSTPTAVLGDDLIRVVKLLHHARQQSPRAHPQVDPMAYPLLFNLKAAPMRVSALAELLHSDISTVSRQVSTLEVHGLVDKVSDPADGRAQVVQLSEEGTRLLARIQQSRTEWFRELMGDWTPEEASDFAGHLERFGADLERHRKNLANPTPSPAPTRSSEN